MGGDLVLTIEDNIIDSNINGNSNCRICHEEEENDESCKRLEAPCACSGTVKFAHRDCIQRWCNEKGDTTCEICLQKYEPGYTAPLPLKYLPTDNDDDLENISDCIALVGNVDHKWNREYFSRGGEESEEFVIITTSGNAMLDGTTNESYDQCSSAQDKTASSCKTVVLILTVLLLARHLLAGGDEVEHYPFSLSTVFALKAFGILLPMYMIIWTVSAVTNIIKRHRHTYDSVHVVFRYV